MSISINKNVYYRTADVCRIVGISRSTFFRWLRNGMIPEAPIRDRRGWRLFTAEDLQRIQDEATCTYQIESEP